MYSNICFDLTIILKGLNTEFSLNRSVFNDVVLLILIFFLFFFLKLNCLQLCDNIILCRDNFYDADFIINFFLLKVVCLEVYELSCRKLHVLNKRFLMHCEL